MVKLLLASGSNIFTVNTAGKTDITAGRRTSIIQDCTYYRPVLHLHFLQTSVTAVTRTLDSHYRHYTIHILQTDLRHYIHVDKHYRHYTYCRQIIGITCRQALQVLHFLYRQVLQPFPVLQTAITGITRIHVLQTDLRHYMYRQALHLDQCNDDATYPLRVCLFFSKRRSVKYMYFLKSETQRR